MSSNMALRVTDHTAMPDLAAAESAAEQFIRALGISIDAESMRDTPRRMARAYAELFTPRPFDLTTFPNDEGYDELVLARAIPVRSVGEHHLLPVVGIAHVGYLPGERILGLSKLARVVEHFACRPQVQERLTKQVADWLAGQLHAKGVGVVIEAEHCCMTLRGVHAVGATTVTSSCSEPCGKIHGLEPNSSPSRGSTPDHRANRRGVDYAVWSAGERHWLEAPGSLPHSDFGG